MRSALSLCSVAISASTRRFERSNALDFSANPICSVMTPFLIVGSILAISPFKYLKRHHDQIQKDFSLKAICQLCTNPNLIYDVDTEDQQLSYLAHLFNRLLDSDRDLYMCYDCGTVARGVFFSLVKVHRGDFSLRKDEIERIKDEYYMNKYEPSVALSVHPFSPAMADQYFH